MTAAERVLNLPELLEAILLQLAPADITRFTRVSPIWRDVVADSTRLQHARILRALPQPCPNIEYVPHCIRPYYVTGDWMRVNPLLTKGEPLVPRRLKCREGPLPYGYAFTLTKRDFSKEALQSARREYVTNPPCDKIHLQTTSPREACVVFNDDGLRIEHLLDVAASLRTSSGNPVAHVHVQFHICADGLSIETFNERK